jgi:hypothetical protein
LHHPDNHPASKVQALADIDGLARRQKKAPLAGIRIINWIIINLWIAMILYPWMDRMRSREPQNYSQHGKLQGSAIVKPAAAL